MFLAIDVGNTNTVFALFDQDAHLDTFRVRTISGYTGDEYASLLKPLLERHRVGFEDISASLIASVVPDTNFNLRRFFEKYVGFRPTFLNELKIDMPIEIDNPKELGADRLINAIAAVEKYQTPAIVIDFGTATTFDYVTENGAHGGGVIAPGAQLSLKALHEVTAKLPKIEISAPDTAIGKNTINAMRSGVYWGYVSMIQGIVERMSAEIGKKPYIIATGGLASLFDKDLDCFDVIDPDLTLEGLKIVWDKSKTAQQ